MKKRKSDIRYTASEHAVHIIAYVITAFCLISLFFPIYWLCITSMKDTQDAFSEPPSFVPTTSLDYGIVIDYSLQQWNSMKQDDFKKEANVTLWYIYSRHTADRIGQLKCYARVDGKVKASAVIAKSSYTLNIAQIWDSNTKLSKDQIAPEIKKIDSLKSVSYNTLSSVPSKTNSSKVTHLMGEELKEIKSYLSGTVTTVYWKNNFWNFTQNYIAAFQYPSTFGMSGGLLQAAGNSGIISISVVLGQWVICGLAGYSLSKLCSRKVGRRVLLIFLTTSMVPTTVTIVATFLVLDALGLSTSFAGVILPLCCSASSILLFKGNFDGVPNEMFEAGRMDGASELRLFTRICMPISRPIFVTIGLLTLSAAWSEFFWSMIILREKSQFTIPLVMKLLYNSSGATVNYTMLMAMSLIVSVPIIFVMIFAQKDLSKGMVFTGLKG